MVIFGSGVGSSTLSWEMAKRGERVAVIERQYIGGSCPNIACLPSRNVIHSAKVASYFGRGKEFGMSDAVYKVDMGAVRERKRKMVAGFNAFELQAYHDTGVEFIMGCTGKVLVERPPLSFAGVIPPVVQVARQAVHCMTHNSVAISPIPEAAEVGDRCMPFSAALSVDRFSP